LVKNKRVSRLAANIPLLKANLAPLSFVDVPREAYAEAVLGVYERNRIDLMKGLFIWAVERSSERYAAVRQTLGAPDPFRFRYREELREVVAELVRARIGRGEVVARVKAWAKRLPASDREAFAAVVEAELGALTDGNYARYRLRPAEFDAWSRGWKNV